MISDIVKLLSKRGDFFLKLLGQHIRISLTAILIAMVLGGIIGVIISERATLSKLVLSTVNFLYTIPSISLLGFLIPFTGIGDDTAIIALTIYALLPMVRNTYTGITNVDARIIEAAVGMGCTPKQLLWQIKLPLAAPVIVAGIKNMAVMTIALSGVASFIGAGGLGVAVYRGITTNNKAMTLVGSLMIAMLAITADLLIGAVEKKLKKHK